MGVLCDLVGKIHYNKWVPFEDWYVDPLVVTDTLTRTGEDIVMPEEFIAGLQAWYKEG